MTARRRRSLVTRARVETARAVVRRLPRSVARTTMARRLLVVALAALLLAVASRAHARVVVVDDDDDEGGLGYIVMLDDDDADAEDLCAALEAEPDPPGSEPDLFPGALLRRARQVACARRVRGVCRRVFRRGALGVRGMVVDAVSRARIAALARCLPRARLEPDQPVRAQGPFDPTDAVPWNLDRLDQAFLPLDGVARLAAPANGGGAGVHAYVIDSGVRASHREFATPVGSRVDRGVDLVALHSGRGARNWSSPFANAATHGRAQGQAEDLAARDCDGHGTHIAGTLAGTTVGVAPNARIHPARVLDCDGDGRASDVVAALDWCAGHVRYNRALKSPTGNADDADAHPAVATLALGLMAGARSVAMERAVVQFIRRTGVLVVVAAGNFRDADACDVSPARVAPALTMGASDATDRAYAYGATGACVDAWAPGVDVVSACGGARRCGDDVGDDSRYDSTYVSQSGTSMAVGHGAGAAALLLGEHPGADAGAVKAALVGGATGGTVRGWTLPGTTTATIRVPAGGWGRTPSPSEADSAFGR